MDETNKPLEYYYRPTVKTAFHVIIVLMVLIELLIIRLNIPRLSHEVWYLVVFRLILASTVPLSIFYRLFFHIRPFINTKFTLSEKGLLMQRGKKESLIEYSQLEKMSVSKWPARWGGGFTLHLKSGQNVNVLALLTNSHELFAQLLEKNKDLKVLGAKQKYLEKSERVEESWKRYRYLRSMWPFFALKHFGVPPMFAIWIRQPLKELGWSFSTWLAICYVVHILVTMTCYHFQEEILHRRTVKLDPAEVSVGEEKAWVIASQVLYGIPLILIFYFVR